MGKTESIKKFFDWAQRAKLILDLAVLIGGAKILRAVFLTFTKVPSVWIAPLAWVGGAIILAIFLAITRKTALNAQSSAVSSSNQLAANRGVQSKGVDTDEFFRMAYYSPLQSEAETNFRIAANEKQPGDKEAFYLKVIGVGTVAILHDQTWWTIFKSQLLALLELNKNYGRLPISKIKEFYDSAALKYPEEYEQDNFDRWLKYMEEQLLLIRHPSDMIEITVKGKDFLKYLVHWGREPSQKRL